MTETSNPEVLVLAACTVDLRTGSIRRDHATCTLTRRERALLAYLAAQPHRDVSLDDLHREVFGFHQRSKTRAAFHTMQRLRRKVERDPCSPDHLVAVRGVGYRFVPREEPEPRIEVVVLLVERPADGAVAACRRLGMPLDADARIWLADVAIGDGLVLDRAWVVANGSLLRRLQS